MVCRKHTKKALHFAQCCLMTGSSHHELGKWLAGLLQPVLEQFWSHCISVLFTFAKTMQNFDIDRNVFMCCFDISSLFINVPLDVTIKICSDALYYDSDLQPVIPKDVFVELIKSATSSVVITIKLCTSKLTEHQCNHHLLRLWPTSSWDIMEKSYFLKCRSLRHTSDMLTIRLLSSITKLKQMNL